MTCDEVNGLIDLYACDECDPAQTRAVREHLVGCDDCRTTLAEARRIQGMLAIHFGQEQSLKRLDATIRREARAKSVPRRVLPFGRRFAAVAALLLVTFGLGSLLMSSSRQAPSPTLQLALVKPEREIIQMPARGKPLFEERAAKAMRVELDAAKAIGDLPDPPAVNLVVRLVNTTPDPMQVETGGPRFRCVLTVSGPGDVLSVSDDAAKEVPFPPKTQTLPPGGLLDLKIIQLESQSEGRVRYLYPTKPGEYRVRAQVEAVVRTRGRERTVHASAGPVVVRLP